MDNDNKNTETITVAPEHSGLAFILTESYRERTPMKPCELYEATRGTWLNLSEKQRSLKFAYAIHKNAAKEYIVKEVYIIEEWFPAGTQEYFTRKNIKFGAADQKEKKEFIGRIAPDDVRNPYLNKKIKLDRPYKAFQKVPKEN